MADTRELPTSEVAKLAGVTAATIRKWKKRGDLKLAPHSYAGAGRGNEAMWSSEAVEEVLKRAKENRNSGYRRGDPR
jgi:transposase